MLWTSKSPFNLPVLAVLGLFCLPFAAQAQVNMTTPGLFTQLGVSEPSDTPSEPSSPPGNDDANPGVTPPPPPDDKAKPKKTPPPPPPAEVTLEVYVAVDGTTTGPFGAATLRRMVTTGELTPETYVWMEGMTEWKQARDVAKLRDILASAPPPPPEEPSFDAVEFLAGTWESDPEPIQIAGVDSAEISGTIEYRRSGDFEGFGTLFMVARGFRSSMNFTLKGTFKVQNASETGFVVTQTGTATYQTPNGPFPEPINGAFKVRIIDQNTIESEEGTRSRRLR